MFPINRADPTGRIPPGQKVTEKFPVMTAGTPSVTPATAWDLTLAVEAADTSVRDMAQWTYSAFRALPQREFICDIHCVTRWSKLDTRWRGVRLDDILPAAGVDLSGEGDASPEELPVRYLRVECDGDYSTNLRLADLSGDAAFIALDYNAGDSFAPLPTPHGGPARLVAPKLYFWKSAKWVRRLILTPFDRKGFWEKLGYHNYGDPWKEQRYRGLSDADHRTTLDMELSRAIRAERQKSKQPNDNIGSPLSAHDVVKRDDHCEKHR